eukprot:PITA_19972
MSNEKFDVEKFTGKRNFALWKLKVRDLLVQQGLHKALDEETKKPTTMIDSDWENLDARALSVIRLCLADEVLFNIVEKEIKMYDNIRTLTSVRHVPDLKKNLISLGVLDSDGYKFTGQNGVLKVFKGALVVMKAEKVGNIYRLKGSTQTNEATIASEKETSTRLWHQRLGHMSEKGLQILMKHKSLTDLQSLKLDFCKHCVYGK